MPVGGGARPQYPQTTATPSPSKFRMQFPHDTNQRALKNRRISTIRFQHLKYTPGNCMRNCWMTEGPACGARGRRRGLAGQRVDAPSRRLAARTARGRAAAHGAARPHSRARRRPERPWGHAAKPRSNTRERVGCLAAPHPSSTPGLSTAVNQPQSINQHSLRRQCLRGANLRGPAAGQPGGDERGHDGDDAHADQL